MSQTEMFTGRVKKINTHDNVIDIAEDILNKKGIEYEDALELLADEYYDEYIVMNSAIYEVVSREWLDDDNDIFNAKEAGDGEIEYTVKYYNGGCGFGEAVETAIKRMEK